MVVAFLTARCFMPDDVPQSALVRRQKFAEVDWHGSGLIACVVMALLFAITQAPKLGWTSLALRAHIICVVFGMALLPVLVRTELLAKSPMLAPEFFGDGQIRICMLIMFSASFCYNGMYVVMPFFMNKVQKMSITWASRIMLVRPIAGDLTGQ